VAYFSDRIGVMYAGRLVEVAATEQIMNHPCHPYTLKLFSSAPGTQQIAQEAANAAPAESLQRKKAAAPPAACPYAAECAASGRACTETEPELREIEAGHQVACCKVCGFLR